MKETYKLFNTTKGQLLVRKKLGDEDDAPYELACETTVWKDGFNVTPTASFQFEQESGMDDAFETIDEKHAEDIIGDLVGALGDFNLDDDE